MSSRRTRVPHRALPYLLVAPVVILLAVFYLYPLGYNLVLSFFDWNMRGPMTFVGLGNFVEMFTDPDFGRILGNTILYMVMDVTLTLAVGFALALYLRRLSWVNRFLESVVFVPTVISLVSVSLVFVWLMRADDGLLNWVLSLVGVEAVGWLTDPSVALVSVALVSVWKSAGLNALIILAAMRAIPPYLDEAAALDRASRWSRFTRITVPMISPTLFFLVLINIIASFQAFDSINVMTQGGPQGATNTLIFSIYREGFSYYRVGYAAAMATVLMVIVGAITAVYFRVLQRKVHYR
ncbi:carbohydrate ABC transporter permease [Microbacterium xanthum]|uniref:carbohydrate ABC transporter permease n=1 Tax=Microbacterium xanthum TaxID=3079794 RepID=UPI002AD1F795|nr:MULTISPECIES: sugar ABC transporter permease [unclassified Microbacterium]MDZ8170706.1 sugar ABC transporter permease [Microbacterium sp. KSW-48]MDZ8201232.1 sugar ABC transporter permease [Microbacterium sp. SSW1-59]